MSLLRIDRSFVSGVHVDIQDHALVSATIDLARTFGLPTTAAGVETDDQFADLTERGCDYAQGYLWSPPTDPSTIAGMVPDQRGSVTEPVIPRHHNAAVSAGTVVKVQMSGHRGLRTAGLADSL